ncbi:ferrochelatase [Marilutibacter chinensis]|uniref:Ferrochelatase n=1 Tax=Marilutibacter chinensis TaxID=2912247 RepID=A0ABS9HS53_9GAMM|nr:ferrochelatase [Lysobacter chinensis]MCF7221755.1 ferrochelatase [Lysobacter chinensis]
MSTPAPPTASPSHAAPATAAGGAALVLVNLGTPDAPTPAAVRRYLSEFLHDRRVVDLTRWLWCPLLHFAILPLRSPVVARKYASIWMSADGAPGGSPLAVHTRELAQAVQSELPQLQVVDAMRYGQPALAAVLEWLRGRGAGRIVVLPLYPQYSTSTTASVADVLARFGAAAPEIELRMIEDYHLDAGWIAAVAESIRRHRATRGSGGHLLFSFHGLPRRFIERGDPYQRQCEASAAAIAATLGLADDAWSLGYQSRFGREEWLAPSTADTLASLAGRGIHDVDVVAPGFAVDCIETLEEIAMMLAEDFAGRGGTLRYIPCLNAEPDHARALAGLVRPLLG